MRADVGPRPDGRVPRLVTVIIPARDSAATLGQQIDALGDQDHTGPWELLLADNGSTDATVRTFERGVAGTDGPWVEARWVDASQRAGSAHARNVGAAEASGDLFCFCDADDVVDRHWLAALVDAVADHHLVGGRLDLDRLNDARVRSWRPAPSAATSDAPAFAPTSNMAIWADVFEALGGLDVDYLKSHDVELSKRARAAGADLGFAPDAVVHYRLRSSLPGLAKQSYRSGRATVQMAVHFPDREPPIVLRTVATRVGWSVTRSPYLLLADRRGLWVRRTAEVAGVIVALVRTRLRRSAAG